MIFNSVEFGVFFFVVIGLCAVLPRARIAILLAVSFVFYSWISWKFGIVLLAMSVVGYASPWIMARAGQWRLSLLAATACVFVILIPLLFLKYWNFAVGAVIWNAAYLAMVTVPPRPLPPGISFHAFQLVAYVIDVYKKRVEPERRLGIFFLFSSFFPQLVAGPIERASHLIPQLPGAGLLSRDNREVAFQLFLHGLFLKVAIADVVGWSVDEVYAASAAQGGAALLLATLLFYVQIYCDFAGYSLMALGVARAIGVTLARNFNAPMLATSPADFWHRWHISLSQWFRDYVYIPLGGSARGPARWVIAVLVTFLLSGLWHGADWTFLVWGGLHGMALIVSVLVARLFSDRVSLWTVTASWVATQAVVTLGWVFFRSKSVTQAIDILGGIVTARGGFDPSQSGTLAALLAAALCGLAWMTWLDQATFSNTDRNPYRTRLAKHVNQTLMIAVIAVALTYGVPGSGQRPFIYFQF